MKGLRFVSTLFVAAVAGCLPTLNGGSFASLSTPRSGLMSANGSNEPIVQVRDSWRSADVGVFAWDEEDAGVGLSTAVTRWGELVGGNRFGDHRLYMSPLYSQDNGGFKYATVGTRRLLRLAAKRDSYACFYGKNCSPSVSYGVRIPDDLLRANRDSLVVTFHPAVYEPWTITLRAELITAYLSRVDSVVARMKHAETAVSKAGSSIH